MPLQNTRPCPCLLAASLHTGSILPGHGSRGAGVSVCAFMCVYWGIQCLECVGKPVYMCACVRPRIKGYSCVCLMFFGVIMLLMSVRKAQTADGFNACGRLMWAWEFACDSKREGDRRMQHVRMCAGVFRQMTPYTPLLLPQSNPPSLQPVPPSHRLQTHPPHPHLHPAMLRPVHNVLTEAGLSSPGTGFQNGCNWSGSVSNYVFTHGWMMAK